MFSMIWQIIFIGILVVASYFIMKKAYKKALLTMGSMTILFYLVSTKIMAIILMQPLLVDEIEGNATAVVVLGSNNEDDRILKGLSLAQEKELPVIFSGIRDDSVEIIRKFKVISTIMEMNSLTTYENAKNTQFLLEPMKVEKIYLVTSEEHMYRAKKIFEKMNIKVLPVVSRPMDLDIDIMSFAPKIKYFAMNNAIVYEYLALIYYKYMERI
jgi:uncharacterized SAM-binding protein YcdF (DUF218 family)